MASGSLLPFSTDDGQVAIVSLRATATVNEE